MHFASCSYHITSYALSSGFAFDAWGVRCLYATRICDCLMGIHDCPMGIRDCSMSHACTTLENWGQLLHGPNIWPIGYGSWQINFYLLLPTAGLFEDETIHTALSKTPPRDWIINHAEYEVAVCFLTLSAWALFFSASLPLSLFLLPLHCTP